MSQGTEGETETMNAKTSRAATRQEYISHDQVVLDVLGRAHQLLRRHPRLTLRAACDVCAPPLSDDVDRGVNQAIFSALTRWGREQGLVPGWDPTPSPRDVRGNDAAYVAELARKSYREWTGDRVVVSGRMRAYRPPTDDWLDHGARICISREAAEGSRMESRQRRSEVAGISLADAKALDATLQGEMGLSLVLALAEKPTDDPDTVQHLHPSASDVDQTMRMVYVMYPSWLHPVRREAIESRMGEVSR